MARGVTASRSALETEKHKLSRARQTLRDVWGYEDFRPMQDEAVADVIASRDSVVVLPTGGGKSLCYQVPALVRDGMAIVVSPLISLMKDQVDALLSNGVDAALVNSTQSMEDKADVAQRIRRGEVQLLYMAPERLLAPKTLDFLSRQNVSFIAIDEAHCVSQWGHDFRPEYRQLGVLRDHFPNASLHAFTATASERVREDIAHQLGLRNHRTLVGNFDRPNLVYRMIRRGNLMDQILGVIQENPGESGIVYAITRREVDELSGSLQSQGIKALPYHAGMSDTERQKSQEAFIREEVDVIVATVAFGMGIDKANVRYVIHAGMPQSIEHYQQESGRAGRDGLRSQCVLIHSSRDLMTWKRILENSTDKNFKTAMAAVEAMASVCTSVRCRHASLVEYFGQEYDSDNCGACDVCLGGLDLVDEPLILAQKILSCVYRVNERFGAAHVVKVLKGSQDKRVVEFGHDNLSTFGLLSEFDTATIRNWIDQLIAQGYAERFGEYLTVKLTDQGRQLLKGIGEVQLTKPLSSQGRAGRSRLGDEAQSWQGVDRGLFDQLRDLRRRLAAERSVPAYVIFGDNVLRQMACIRPSSLKQMGTIAGIGQAKLQDLGPKFFKAIEEYCKELNLARDQAPQETKLRSTAAPASKPSSITANTAFTYFEQGMSVPDVAAKIGRALSTTHGYLQNYIQERSITDPRPWIETNDITAVEQALQQDPTSKALRPVYEALQEKVTYNDIRIIAACLRNRQEAGTQSET
jgi:ATP-dependent DNA helicase RecQ